MRLKDVEPYMKVECTSPGLTHINKGEVAEVISINHLDETIDVRGYLGHYHPSHFKPYNKYNVGEEVVDFERTGKLVEIWAAHKKGVYAIKYKDKQGDWAFDIRLEKELAYKKEKDNLEIGDKFISNIYNRKYEVIFVHYNGHLDEIEYYVKSLESGDKGKTELLNVGEVEEIIYD